MRGVDVSAAEWLAWGLGKGAEKAGHLMKYSSGKTREKLQPEPEQRHIDPRAQQGIYYTRQAAGAAVKVSGFLGKRPMGVDYKTSFVLFLQYFLCLRTFGTV